MFSIAFTLYSNLIFLCDIKISLAEDHLEDLLYQYKGKQLIVFSVQCDWLSTSEKETSVILHYSYIMFTCFIFSYGLVFQSLFFVFGDHRNDKFLSWTVT